VARRGAPPRRLRTSRRRMWQQAGRGSGSCPGHGWATADRDDQLHYA
jgi:hypothetical protein